MSEQDNIKIAQASFAAINAHDLDKWSSFQADDYMADNSAGPGTMNKEQTRMLQQGFQTAFPDLHFEVTRTIAQGDYVVLHWMTTGTHTGPMRTASGNTVPPTGKKGTVSGSSTVEIKNGKITRAWAFWDTSSLLTQLGLMPPM